MKKNITKHMRLFLLVWLLTLALRVQGQTIEPVDQDFRIQHADSSVMESHRFDQHTLDELKADSDMQYRQPPSVAESLWQRMINWIGELFSWLFEGAVNTDWGRVFMIILGITTLVILTMMLLKVNAVRVFISGADRVSSNAFHENIHEMNFDQLIREALESKDYRLAVRLLFLSALKLLADKQLLQWKPGKTNHDYVNELSSGELRLGLNKLSFFFEYAWYGQFSVDEAMFQRVQLTFDDWKKKVGL